MNYTSIDMAYPPTAHTFKFPAAHDHQDDVYLPSTLPFHSPPPQHFNGSASFLMKRSMSFSGVERSNEEVHADDDLSDDGIHLGEKKKRLNLEQVKALEKSFELGNKLEPERKMQLAKALGLQPRQIAIWFQNRRARWKTKQLEKDYDVLKKQFEALKADNDSLHLQNKKLHAELLALRSRDSNEAGITNTKKETEGYASNGSENSSEINLDVSIAPITVMNSPAVVSSHQLSSKLFFPPSSQRATSMTQLLQGSSRSSEFQCLKVDQMIQEESFCNIFGGIEDQQPAGYWPWPEQQQYN